ncbi:hypothetical protein GHK68_35870 [Sinorhizobium meliloti]|uniref:hypothetical protein n=1 Tax=Rhizobium meliloti TaxID=382 RepID=UPI001296F438|nr:hypothetical protein [Sinorhizobium meliloti]MQW47441.1 hypothetical protein [Sinorhizobium meliloti]
MTVVSLIREGKLDPVDVPNDLRRLFGDFVVTEAIRKTAQELGGNIQQGNQGYTRTGGILVPAAAAASTLAVSRAAAAPVSGSRHTFFGDPV